MTRLVEDLFKSDMTAVMFFAILLKTFGELLHCVLNNTFVSFEQSGHDCMTFPFPTLSQDDLDSLQFFS